MIQGAEGFTMLSSPNLTSVCVFERLCVLSHLSTYGHKSKGLYVARYVVYVYHRQSGQVEVGMATKI